MRMGANGALLFTLLIYAAVICIAVRIIKYFIRYGIDYYFEKRTEYQKNQKQTVHAMSSTSSPTPWQRPA